MTYYRNSRPNKESTLLGTFYEWNGCYYIGISIDLCETRDFPSVVVHETRHMVVAYLKEKKVIDLSKYTEEIAKGDDSNYNKVFNAAVKLYLASQK